LVVGRLHSVDRFGYELLWVLRHCGQVGPESVKRFILPRARLLA